MNLIFIGVCEWFSGEKLFLIKSNELCQRVEMARFPRQEWLSDMDSNHDKGLQRALCYHYTTGQTVAGT